MADGLYDESCEDLARDFLTDVLGDDTVAIEAHAPILAQLIQDTIESYIAVDVEGKE